jgi:Fe-S-cluster-containing hydrogenase component 2
MRLVAELRRTARERSGAAARSIGVADTLLNCETSGHQRTRSRRHHRRTTNTGTTMNHAVLDELRVEYSAPCQRCGANTGQPCQPGCLIAAIQAKLDARLLWVPL